VPLLALEQLKTLPEPYEILDLYTGQARAFHVLRFEQGKLVITPRDGRPQKQTQVLRLHVPVEDKPLAPHWWDLTSKRGIVGLLGFLENGHDPTTLFRLTKVGAGPAAAYQIDVTPAARP
jgi:hypothetical protein